MSLAVIIGAGPGIGLSLGLAFAKRHAVALLARTPSTLQELTDTIKKSGGDASAFACDATSNESIQTAFKQIAEKYPSHKVKVAVMNAGSKFIMKPFLELTEDDFRPGIDLNIIGAAMFSQAAIKAMLSHGEGGTLILTGATASTKGGAKFSAFAPSKFALRGLSQCLAREFGPQGIHVAHSILDGLVDTARVKDMVGGSEQPDSRISPDDIAKAYVYLSEQQKSCWTQELDLRPYAEKW